MKGHVVDSNDIKRELFFTIEKKDPILLETYLESCPLYIVDSMYQGPSEFWSDFFLDGSSCGSYGICTKEKVANIKAYICGCMDFTPVQHAFDLYWHIGTKIIAKYLKKNKGTFLQGSGQRIVIIDKILSASDEELIELDKKIEQEK